jgi:prepilin-type N-terminal cleavage/methylation domain-containing protein
MSRRKAFTLIELIVVIAVLLMVASILLPSLNAAREQARAVQCQNNLHSLWEGYLAFAASHENHLPGGYFDSGNPDPDKRDWMLGAQTNNYLDGPQAGTLFKYVNHSYAVYRCPSLDLAAVAWGGPGGGSNGRFDYAAFLYPAGCRLDRLPLQATVTDPTSGNKLTVPAPVIVEEESAHMNSSHQMEAGHSNSDTLASQHRGGCFFSATDGSVQWIGPPWINAQANNWSATSIRGKAVNLGTTSITWGWYERQ